MPPPENETPPTDAEKAIQKQERLERSAKATKEGAAEAAAASASSARARAKLELVKARDEQKAKGDGHDVRGPAKEMVQPSEVPDAGLSFDAHGRMLLDVYDSVEKEVDAFQANLLSGKGGRRELALALTNLQQSRLWFMECLRKAAVKVPEVPE